jgi:hypothetical protein
LGSLRNPSLCRLLLYLGLALVMTWPMVADPLGTVPGHPEASVGCHIWVIWWAQNHLSELHTDLLFHPQGADVVQLYGSDALSPLLLGVLPLPPALLYNLWVLTLLVGGAWGVDRLCRQLGATVPGAALGAVVFECAPFFQHELLNGTTEMLAAAALPWFGWALLRVLEAPGRDRGLMLGGIVSLGVLASAYNLYFMLLTGTIVVLHGLSTRMDPVLTRPVLKSLGWGALLTAPVAVGLAWLHSSHGAGETYSRRASLDELGVVLPDSYANLEAWVSPRPIELPFMMTLPDGSSFEYWTTCTVFLGLFSLGLALYSSWSRRSLGPLGVTAIVAGLIAMGPFLRVDGEAVLLAGQALPLPSLVLADLTPPFRITALHAYRYAVLVVLGVAVLVAQAMRWRPRVAMGAGLLVIVEAFCLSPVPWPARTTEIPDSATLQTLADSPEGAVLQVPMRTDDLGELGGMLLAQSVHGHPVHDGGIHRRAGEDATALFRDLPALNLLSAVGERRIPDPRQTSWTLRQLYSSGYRYVLVDAEDAEGRYWAGDNLGTPTASDEHWMLWTIEAQDRAPSATGAQEGRVEP